MPVMDIKKDPEALTMEVTCRFAASAERVWQLWADPRQLERWWGPPGYPATVTEHELAAGSKVAYYMTGPEGQKYPGWWTVIAVEPPHRLELQDGFSDADGEPDDSMPTTSMTVTVGDAGDETEMRILSRFPSVEDMNQLLEMGMDQGIQQALSQIDAILAEAPTIGLNPKGPVMPVVSCEKDPSALALVITAIFDAPPERTWQLWTDPRQLERWWGPPGCTTTFTTYELAPGGRVDYVTTSPDGEEHHDWWRVVAVDAPHTLDVADGLAYESGAPDPNVPIAGMLVTIVDRDGGSEMTVTTSFPSREALEQHVGFEENMTAAMNRMDDILSERATQS